MGILDRKYSRRDDEEPEPPGLDELLHNRWVWIGLAALIVIAIVFGVMTPKKPRPLDEGSRLVNINTATAVELESLPGIGSSLAVLIINSRPYKDVNDLERVTGISQRQVEQLRPLLTVSESNRNIGSIPIWERFLGLVSALNVLLLALGCSSLAALYVLFRWLRTRWRKFRTANVRAMFEEAERRRWEAHRREKK